MKIRFDEQQFLSLAIMHSDDINERSKANFTVKDEIDRAAAFAGAAARREKLLERIEERADFDAVEWADQADRIEEEMHKYFFKTTMQVFKLNSLCIEKTGSAFLLSFVDRQDKEACKDLADDFLDLCVQIKALREVSEANEQ